MSDKSIRTDITEYNGSIIHSRFAYKYLRKNVSPTGDILAFVGPMHVEGSNMIDLEDLVTNDFIYSEKAVNFIWEIPGLTPMGAVFFQRYFNTKIAFILTKYMKYSVEVSGDDIFVLSDEGRKKASVSITYTKDGVAIGHTGINIIAGNAAPDFAYSTLLNDDDCMEFMHNCVEDFYSSTKDCFIATTKITL